MSIEIKHVDGRVLYTAKSATDVRSAILEAIGAKVDLRGSNLSGSDLSGSDLRGSDLSGSDLSGSNLSGSDLSGSDLRGSDLRGSDLRYSDLSGSDLRYSNLRGSNLRYSDLSGSDLSGSDLRYSKNAELVIAQTRIIPDEGPIIGWKKARDNKIVKLRIPAKAKRSHASGRKCRSDRAKVLAIFNADGTDAAEAFSQHDERFRYEVGAVVTPRLPFEEDMWNECASGIHWFTSRIEAENYS